MRVIALKTLRDFWEKHPQAEIPLRAWYALASRADWRNPADIKAAYRNASFLANNRVVFNIKGNDYRLVVAMRYDKGIIFVRFVGAHREYDRINAEEV
jgi:mRNA interferase HigB